MIPNRNLIKDILPDNCIGCELGVFEGDFSQKLLDSNKFSILYLVDSFHGHASNFGKKYKDASVLEKIVSERFKDNSNVKIIKNTSINFLNSMPENFFDFIYIDTVHDYNITKQELEYSRRVIKNKGLLCGHDFHTTKFPLLVRAVTEFCKKYNYTYSLTSEDHYPSYLIKIDKNAKNN